MKELSDVELHEFKERALRCMVHGHTIALADLYRETLEAEAGAEVPEGVEEGSAGHLYALACAAQEARAGGAKKASKPEPKAKEPKAASVPPPAPKAEVPPPPPATEKVEEQKEESKSEGAEDHGDESESEGDSDDKPADDKKKSALKKSSKK